MRLVVFFSGKFLGDEVLSICQSSCHIHIVEFVLDIRLEILLSSLATLFC
jgi:hypothetical protein